MSEILVNAAAIVAAVLLMFSLVVPVHAMPDGQAISEQTPSPQDPQADQTSGAEIILAANQPPVITIWYENALNFGQIGNPQTQINILGNVSDPDGSVSSLSYRFNGGSPVALTIGPNGTRLVSKGDFDVNLNTSALLNGTNTLVITATDNSGASTSKTVTFNYTRGKSWPMPYTTNWGSASSINAQAQVVDGLWQITTSGIRPTVFGYDRLVAIGDINWTNYEVLVPITVRAFYPDPANLSDAGGVGIIARWQGHTGSGQPPSGWNQLGAYGYYSNRLNALALRLDANDPATQNFPFSYNKTYLFKLRAETVTGGGKYSLKVWEQGQPEPAWNSPQFTNVVNLVDTNNDLLKGSVLLVAHRADATFGNVTVCPLSGTTYPLTINKVGGGTVTSSPNKTSFNCGEGVSLSATPAPGWIFAGWSGDFTSNSSTLNFNMTRPYAVTANFRQGQPINLGYSTYLPFVRK